MGRREQMRRRIEDEARTHDDSCNCRTCRAASGDDEAMQMLMKELL